MSDLDLLYADERLILKAIAASQAMRTPQNIAQLLDVGGHGIEPSQRQPGRPWTHQAVARVAAQLKRMGFIKIEKLPRPPAAPKMTVYHLTPQGEAALAELSSTADTPRETT